MEYSGLSSEKARELLKTHGPNEIDASEKRSPITLFLSQFPTFLNAILAVAALLSLFLTHFIDGIFIGATILLNGLLGFIQEYKAEKSLEKLKEYSDALIRVRRDGKVQEISPSLLVPGDIVILSEGDRIPADGKLHEVTSLEIDEAILTGESMPIRKNSKDLVFAGTLAIKGRGIMEVVTTGNKTRFGDIATTLATLKQERTPLQKQLVVLGKYLSFMAIGIALLLIPIGIYQKQDLTQILLVTASIAIASVPEGLPAVVTIALAIGTNRLARRKAIVRQMPAIEALGSVQYILVDKTGTLTQNSMEVKASKIYRPSDLPHLLQACILGNTATLVERSDGKHDVVGDKTDGALLVWAKSQKRPSIAGKVVDEFVFDSDSKTVTTVWDDGKTHHVFVRGAPESVLSKSSLTQKEREEVEKEFIDFAKKGLRVIAFGHKTAGRTKVTREEHEKNLTFLGFVGLYDPPRLEVKQAIKDAHLAGITTIMVTGDNEVTALAIAKEIGLTESEEGVITGDKLAKLSDEEVVKALETIRIFARSEPQDKLRLTTLLQAQGKVIGVTGDGVNDALALKKASVGVAMGKMGTDVAKEASDIVLTDDNFSTLIKAIDEGRAIYRNIVTSIVYLLTSNLSEITLVLFATLFGLPTVLLPTQILWINLVTDTFPAIALATDTSLKNMLKKKPRDPSEPILTGKRILFIVLVGSGIAILLTLLYSFLLGVIDQTAARTIIFTGLVISHMGLAVFMRGQSILSMKRFFLGTIVISIGIQIAILFIPFFKELFQIGF